MMVRYRVSHWTEDAPKQNWWQRHQKGDVKNIEASAITWCCDAAKDAYGDAYGEGWIYFGDPESTGYNTVAEFQITRVEFECKVGLPIQFCPFCGATIQKEEEKEKL